MQAKVIKEILEELRKRNIKVAHYKVSTDYETGEHTLIIRTPSISSVKYSSDLENELQNKILKNFKHWDLIIVPTGRNKRETKRFKRSYRVA